MASYECTRCAGSGSKPIRLRERDGSGSGKVTRVLTTKTCHVCGGSGVVTQERLRRRDAAGGYKKKANRKSYPHYEAGGVEPVTVVSSSDELLALEEEDEELSFLTGKFRIFQRVSRHRYSSDDLVCAYVAVRELMRLRREVGVSEADAALLDIGCGLGSILLSSVWILLSHYSRLVRGIRAVGVEVQESRLDLARKSLQFNLGPSQTSPHAPLRWALLSGDLRDPALEQAARAAAGEAPFHLVTGSPPYFVPDPQQQPRCFESTGCLFERCGGVEEYLAAAARLLVSEVPAECPGIFVMVNTALGSDRVYRYCGQRDVSVVKRVDVIPKAGKDALFCIFVIALDAALPCVAFPPLRAKGELSCGGAASGASRRGEVVESLVIREADGSHSEEYAALLAFLCKPSSRERETY